MSISRLSLGRFAELLSYPLRYYASRLFLQSKNDLRSVATETIEITAYREVRRIHAYFWPDHVERIVPRKRYSLDLIVNYHLNRPNVELYPLTIYRLGRAALLDGSIYVPGSARRELRSVYSDHSWFRKKSILPEQPIEELQEGVLCSTIAGSSWFGHWLEDEVPLLMIADNYGTKFQHNRELYSHEVAYLNRIGINPPVRLDSALFGSLTIIDEFAQNANKTSRYLEIRKALTTGSIGFERIYLRRGRTGTRRQIENEEQLIIVLKQAGFKIIDIESSSLSEITDSCRGSSLIVSIEGSHLAHILYLAKAYALLIILCPPNQVHTTVADIAPFCQLQAALFVCSPLNPLGTVYSVDADELMRFIDQAERQAVSKRPLIDLFLADVLGP